MSAFFTYDPFTEFERIMNETFVPALNTNRQLQQRGTPSESAVGTTFKPRMDLHEDNAKNLVTATFELPGIKKEDVALNIENGRLNISAETKFSGEQEGGEYVVLERRYGKFSRTLQLPEGVNDQDVKASMDNGLLTITFPKSTPEQAPKRIAIA